MDLTHINTNYNLKPLNALHRKWETNFEKHQPEANKNNSRRLTCFSWSCYLVIRKGLQ